MSGPAVEAGVGAGPSKSDELAAVKQKDLKQAEASTTTALSAPLAAPAAGLDGASPPGAAAAIAQTLASGQASSSNGHGHTVVPAYPYNVSMAPFIPGHSSARTDGYFEQHVPDDSNVQTRLPSICVDYLSHDWEEDDVWTSWKAMTKHKTEIANGVRLENASWRTWAKQRGKLKTISPETLNWLKDSDVTWLYGPLHTAVEPVPLKRAATAEDYLGLDKSKTSPTKSSTFPLPSTNIAPGAPGAKPKLTVKPILKHRSLSDILSVPSSGAASPIGEASLSDAYSEDGSEEGDVTANEDNTKSDQTPTSPTKSSHQHRRRSSSNGSSPPRVSGKPRSRTSSMDSASSRGDRATAHNVASSAPHQLQSHYEEASYDLPTRPGLAGRRSTSHDQHRHHSSTSVVPKKRHITFNHKVEQCISLDVEEEQNRKFQGGGRGGHQPYSNTLQRYGPSGRAANSSSSSTSTTSSSSSDDDEEDEVLTFKSSSPRSPSFVKPFLASPTDPNGPAGGRARGQGHLVPAAKPQPHTIAKIAPTTLKESELLPGPTPIVVMEDGRITALYGTEEDYVYDAEEHGGMDISDWAERIRGEGSETEEDDDALVETAKREPTDLPLDEGVSYEDSIMPMDEDQAYYNEKPSTSVNVTDAQLISTSSRFEGDPHSSLLQAAKPANHSDYFSGPDNAVADDYDTRYATASQRSYAGGAATNDAISRGAAPGQLQASNALLINASNQSSASSSDNNVASLAASPRSGGIPSKSILKKSKENTSGEYYPPLPPASTRASRAHAAMFSEDGEVIERSPMRNTVPLPGSENANLIVPAIDSSTSSNTPGGNSASNATSPSLSNNSTRAEPEPTRGRSISRGSSSSSLVDRVGSSQSLIGESYGSTSRTRSTSGGHSVSPVPSYSPPYTASLNSLGAGTAVMQSEPVDMPKRGRTGGGYLQATKPSSRREAIDSSSDEDNSSSTEHEDDDARNMDIQLDVESISLSPGPKAGPATSGVNFARQSKQHPSSSASQTQSQQRRQQSYSGTAAPENSKDREDEEGFESRPTFSAANVGRTLVGALFGRSSPSKAEASSSKAGTASPSSAKKMAKRPANKQIAPAKAANTTSPTSKHTQHTHQQPTLIKIGSPSSSRQKADMAGEGEGLDDDEEDDDNTEILFASPYMPSSPTYLSSSNLPALAAGVESNAVSSLRSSLSSSSGQDRRLESYQVRWADPKPEPPSTARNLLLRTLGPPSTQERKDKPAYRYASRQKHNRSATEEDDELSDPANNGYSYSYGFDSSGDDDDEPSKGVVGRAVDLAGALWNVGSGMIWGPAAPEGQRKASTGE